MCCITLRRLSAGYNGAMVEKEIPKGRMKYEERMGGKTRTYTCNHGIDDARDVYKAEIEYNVIFANLISQICIHELNVVHYSML